MKFPEYRPIGGFALWIGAAMADAALHEAGVYGQNVAGLLALLGFVAALTWALGWGWWRRSEPVDVGGSS